MTATTEQPHGRVGERGGEAGVPLLEEVEGGDADQGAAGRVPQRELGDQGLPGAGGEHDDAAATGTFPGIERLGLVRVGRDVTGVAELQGFKGSGTVLEGETGGAQGLDDLPVPPAWGAPGLTAVVPREEVTDGRGRVRHDERAPVEAQRRRHPAHPTGRRGRPWWFSNHCRQMRHQTSRPPGSLAAEERPPCTT